MLAESRFHGGITHRTAQGASAADRAQLGERKARANVQPSPCAAMASSRRDR
jgi:hypothetical protein